MTTLEKIKEIIENNDCLVEFPHGNEHCILPELYDELSHELLDLFDELGGI